MITRLSLAGLALAAALAPGTPALASTRPAQVALPGYTCDRLVWQGGNQWDGVDRCVPSAGASASGPLDDPFTITSRETGATFTCTPNSFGHAGTAQTPQRVLGNRCSP
jgi:hypothetical protein